VFCLPLSSFAISIYKPLMSRPADPIIQVEDTGDERIDTSMSSTTIFMSLASRAPSHFTARNPTTNVPQSEQHQSSRGQPTFSDGAEPIFNMYVKMSQEEDNKMADRWQKDADGILIFVSSSCYLHASERSDQREHRRPVYSLLLLRHCSQYRSRT
jgi:hypothetical protein